MVYGFHPLSYERGLTTMLNIVVKLILRLLYSMAVACLRFNECESIPRYNIIRFAIYVWMTYF